MGRIVSHLSGTRRRVEQESERNVADEESTSTSTTASRRISVGVIGPAVLAVALVVFIVQNTGSAEITWLVFEQEAPLWVVIVVAVVVGAVLTEVAGWFVRRRRK